MFIKSLLGEVAAVKEWNRTPYVVYIDNPGTRLSEFIGTIISRIGEETFKKYVWSKVIEHISRTKELRNKLEAFEYKGDELFGEKADPYSQENSVSHRAFIDSFALNPMPPKKRKELEDALKYVVLKGLEFETGDTTLAEYFYELISVDFGVNKTWEALSSGNIKRLERKEADIIKYIVGLLKYQGFTDVFILVDEFEDITKGRLSKAQSDNYVYNLRSLLDDQREWCLVFAMTGEALTALRSLSPPLADRISTKLIHLQDLNKEQANKIVINFLNLARQDESDVISPFDDSGITKLYELVEGNQRQFLKNCYHLVEKAADKLESNQKIDLQFVEANFFSYAVTADEVVE